MSGRTLLLALVGAAALVAVGPLAQPADPEPPKPLAGTDAAAAPGECVLAIAGPERVHLERRAETEPVQPTTTPAPGGEERLLRVLAELDAGHDDASMVAILRDLLVDHAELAAAFPGHVRAAARSTLGRTRLLQALARCGDASCQQALSTILTAAVQSASLREQALRSLGDVCQPTAATLTSLWSHAHAGAEQSRSALLAFGQATARIAARDPRLHQSCCQQLRDELRTATDAARTGILLKTLASSGSAHAVDEAICFLGATDASVRAIAAQVLLGGEDVQVEAIVQDLLRTEPDPEVRRIILRGRSLRTRA